MCSPYSKGAGNPDARIFVMLQDWASDDYLCSRPAPELKTLGRDSHLPTNRNLESLLRKHFHVGIGDIFATNLFPYIKLGGIDRPIPQVDLVCAARFFGVPQIRKLLPAW